MALRASVLFVVIAAVLSGCDGGGSYECELCVSVPDAVPADDRRPAGEYKGVLTAVDTSGAIRITLRGDNQGAASEGSCLATVDGHAYSAAELQVDGTGEPGGVSYTFNGPGFRVLLQLAETGDVRDAEVWLDDRQVRADVIKELSTALVRCYEGSWGGGGVQGTWNFIVRDSDLQGTYDGDNSGRYSGQVSGESVEITDGVEAAGSIRGDRADGTWSAFGLSGSWSGRRTL